MAKKQIFNTVDLKTKIILSAREIVIKQGHKALNIRDIAQKSGCSTGTLYNTFKNMDEILLYINGETLDLLLATLKKGYENAKRTKHVGRSMGKIYIHFTREHHALWTLLFDYQHLNPKEIPHWYQEKVDSLFSFIQNALTLDLKGDKKKLAQLAHTLWASLHGICVLEFNGKLLSTKSDAPEKLWDTLYVHLLNGFKQSVDSEFANS